MATAVSACDFAFRTGGASAAYLEQPLQRAWRDIHMAAQHVMFSPAMQRFVAARLLGIEEGPAILLRVLCRIDCGGKASTIYTQELLACNMLFADAQPGKPYSLPFSVDGPAVFPSTSVSVSLDELAGAPAAEECRVVICGGADIFQAGLVAVLSSASGISVVKHLGFADYNAQDLAQLSPHVVVVDLDTQPDAGLAIAESADVLAEGFPQVIALASLADMEQMLEAILLGANGLLSKQALAPELVEAVWTVRRGGTVINSKVAVHLVQRFANGKLTQERCACHEHMPPRQRQVLFLVGQGLSNDEIAERISLSRHTVKSHISALLRTLNLRDRTQLAIFACQHGFPAFGRGG